MKPGDATGSPAYHLSGPIHLTWLFGCAAGGQLFFQFNKQSSSYSVGKGRGDVGACVAFFFNQNPMNEPCVKKDPPPSSLSLEEEEDEDDDDESLKCPLVCVGLSCVLSSSGRLFFGKG